MDRFGIYPGPQEAQAQRQANVIAQAVAQLLTPPVDPRVEAMRSSRFFQRPALYPNRAVKK